ncbi:MAG: hypothetical protein R6X14_01365, partial [bacterium]
SNWEPETLLVTKYHASAPSNPAIAARPGGNNVHVVFTQRDTASAWTKVYHIEWSGTSWGTVTRLDTATTSRYAYEGGVAVDASNNVHVTWRQNGVEATYTRIWYRGRFGGTWGSIEEVTSPFPNLRYFYRPCVAATPGGNVHVTWTGYPFESGTVYRAYHRARISGSWGNVDTISDNMASSQDYPAVAVRADTVHVVWRGIPLGGSGINLQYRRKNGPNWEPVEVMVDFPAGTRYYPAVQADNNGEVHLVWYDTWNGSASSYNDVWYLRRTPDQPDDVGITAVWTDYYTTAVGDAQTISAEITNFGTNTQTSIPLFYNAGGSNVSETWTGSLAPGATTEYTFTTTWTPSSVGNQDLVCATTLSGDGNPNNDTLVEPVYVWPAGTKVGQTFNGTAFPPRGWHTQLAGGTRNWERSTVSIYPSGFNPYEGDGMAEYRSYSAYPPAGSRLVTHKFRGTDSTIYTVDFWHLRTSQYNYYDSLYVLYAVGDSTNWTVIDGWRHHDPTNPGWVNVTVSTGEIPANTDAWVALYAVSDWWHGAFVDFFQVYKPADNDVGVSAFVEPSGSVGTGVTYFPTVRVTNFGTLAQSNIPVGVIISENGTQTYSQSTSYAGPLAPGATADVAMTVSWTAPAKGTPVELVGYTALSGDEAPHNDTLTWSTNVAGVPNRYFEHIWTWNSTRTGAGIYGATGVQDTLVWTSLGFLAPWKVYIFDFRTQAVVDSFNQYVSTGSYGYRDMCYDPVENVVYAGSEGNRLDKINASSPYNLIASYTVSGSHLPSVVRSLTLTEDDSLYTANFGTYGVIKMSKTGTNAHRVIDAPLDPAPYGLALDKTRGMLYGTAGGYTGLIWQYGMPEGEILADTTLNETGATALFAGAELFRNDTFLLIARQAGYSGDPSGHAVFCYRVIPEERDLGVDAILAPTSRVDTGEVVIPQARVKN